MLKGIPNLDAHKAIDLSCKWNFAKLKLKIIEEKSRDVIEDLTRQRFVLIRIAKVA